MEDNVSLVAEQFNDIEKVIDNLINDRGWSLNECQVILGPDFNTNLDGDSYRDAASIKPKLRGELLVNNAIVSA